MKSVKPTQFFAVLLATGLTGALAAQSGSFQDDSGDARREADKLSSRQMVDRSEDHIDEMRDMLKDVLGILQEARSEKDVVKLNCVNESLTQVKGLLRVSEQSSISLQEAVVKKEDSGARHEYTKIIIARSRIQQLRAQAEECIGQLAFVIDEDTVVVVDIPEDLPDDAMDIDPVPPVMVRPAPISPT